VPEAFDGNLREPILGLVRARELTEERALKAEFHLAKLRLTLARLREALPDLAWLEAVAESEDVIADTPSGPWIVNEGVRRLARALLEFMGTEEAAV
jgi:hypothetical protein